ncbi:MAG: type I restriction enzyme HsdR N-terminal domain-containing protein [Bacteroidetes bacterium]|nr:type I restriction enzyme HsdR N-terminal domain-containing protein [Bacteroidota bacterium]
MFSFPILTLPPAKLELKKSEHQFLVKCLVRKKWLVLTPEEWVRQHYIFYLRNNLNIPISYISVEKSLRYGELIKRWDILVFSKSHTPLILIECKAPHVALTNQTLFQLFTYHHVMQGKYLGLSNGIEHKFYTLDSKSEKKIIEITCFPSWN